ncbi:hypothetical protein [Croceimicrobium sp.]|uniref:hypothetical protein n=1 Tax=Croceimicrobium sp. TaxID=2828340 RepID=UPI003BAB8D76
MIRFIKPLFLLALSISLVSCTKPDDIINDFDVHVNPTFYRYIAITDLVDVSDSNAVLPANLRIRLSGPDASKIYALDGTQNIQNSGKLVQLMVPTEQEPVAGSSLRFSINASAPGYLGSNLSYEVKEGQYYQNKELRLLNTANLPSNIAVGTAGFSTNPSTGETSDTIQVSAQTANSKVALTIPPGTKFLDEQGNLILGKKASRFEIEIIDGSVFIAVWDGAIDLVVPTTGNGDVSLGEGEDFSFAAINENGGLTEILTPPGLNATVRLDIDPNLYNPETLQPFAVGDRAGVKYFEPEEQVWKFMSNQDLVVKKDDNDVLYIDISVDPLSYSTESSAYRLWYSPKLTPSYEYSISSNLKSANVPSATGNLELVFEILNTNIQYVVELGGSFNYESPSITSSNPQQDIKALQPLVLKEVRAKSGSLKNSNYSFNASETSNGWKNEIDYNSAIDPVTLAYRLRCDGAFIQPPVGVVMYYRAHDPSDEAPFSELYRFVNNTVSQYSFTSLEDGAYYDFRAQYGQDQIDTMNVKVIDGHTYDINLPQSVCNKIGF